MQLDQQRIVLLQSAIKVPQQLLGNGRGGAAFHTIFRDNGPKHLTSTRCTLQGARMGGGGGPPANITDGHGHEARTRAFIPPHLQSQSTASPARSTRTRAPLRWTAQEPRASTRGRASPYPVHTSRCCPQSPSGHRCSRSLKHRHGAGHTVTDARGRHGKPHACTTNQKSISTVQYLRPATPPPARGRQW